MDFEQIRPTYENKKIVVTGASGYLASTLLDRLSRIDSQIIRLTRQKSLPPLSGSNARVVDLCGDIRERSIWEEALADADFVFHLAAQTDIALSEEDSYADFNCNVLPLIHLLNICREREYCPVILFAGTSTISGLPEKLPVNESHRDDPLTPYCLHKLTAEKYLKDYVRLGAVKGAILRLASVYGPSSNLAKCDRGVLNKMILRAKQGEPLFLYGKPDRLRDYVFIEDVMDAFLTAGSCIESLNGEHFVIGSGEGHSLDESFRFVIENVESVSGKRVDLKYREESGETPTIEQRDFVADVASFSEKTGWRPQYLLRDGIGATLKSFMTNEFVE